MPLSCGVVEGERLKCCYHAWVYNEHGRCAVPYLPKGVPMPRGVRAYPSREAYGLIFVFPGDPALADTVPFPDLPAVRSPAHKTMMFARQTDCHYSFMHENLMDMNHQFLHRRFLKRVKPTLLAVRKDKGKVEVDYKFELMEGKAPLGSKFMLGRRDSATQDGKFDIMTVGTHYPYQILQLRHPGRDEPAVSLWSAYVPVDRAQRTNLTVGLLTIQKPRWRRCCRCSGRSSAASPRRCSPRTASRLRRSSAPTTRRARTGTRRSCRSSSTCAAC